jgi:hypothetical protein
MSALRVNNVNVGGTSVDGVIQQVDSQGDPNTAGNKITLKTNGTNTVDGGTVFNDAVQTKTVEAETFTSLQTVTLSNNNDYFGKILTFQNNGFAFVETGPAAGTIVTLINQGSGNIGISAGSGLTLYHVGNGTATSLNLAQYGMCTIIYTSTTEAWISGVGLS